MKFLALALCLFAGSSAFAQTLDGAPPRVSLLETKTAPDTTLGSWRPGRGHLLGGTINLGFGLSALVPGIYFAIGASSTRSSGFDIGRGIAILSGAIAVGIGAIGVIIGAVLVIYGLVKSNAAPSIEASAANPELRAIPPPARPPPVQTMLVQLANF